MLIEPLDHLQTQRTRDGIDVLNVAFGGRQQADKMFDVVPLLPPGGRKEQLHRMIVPFDLWRLTAVVDRKLRHLTKGHAAPYKVFIHHAPVKAQQVFALGVDPRGDGGKRLIAGVLVKLLIRGEAAEALDEFVGVAHLFDPDRVGKANLADRGFELINLIIAARRAVTGQLVSADL